MTSVKNIFLALFVGFIISSCTFLGWLMSHHLLSQVKEINQSADSLTRSIELRDQRKSDSLILAIEASPLHDSPKAKDILATLHSLHQKTDTLTTYIDGLLKKVNEGATEDFDVNIGTKLLVDGPDGRLLKKKLIDHVIDINVLMKNYPLTSALPMDIKPPYTNQKPEPSWEKSYFGSVPKVAVLTILDKFKNDVKATETICVKRLASENLTPNSQ